MLIWRSAQTDKTNPTAARHHHDDEHELLLVENGRGRQLLADREVPCHAGEVYWFPPGAPHMSHCRPGESFTCLVVAVKTHDLADGSAGDGGRALLATLTAAAPTGGRLRCAPLSRQKVKRLLLQALAEQKSSMAYGAVLVRTLLTQALLTLARDVRLAGPRDEGEGADAHVDRALEAIRRGADAPLRLNDLLALGPLGRSRFIEHFRARTGSTMRDVLARERMDLARRLLSTTDLPVVDVALAAGFGSQSHFTHRFVAAEGMPPAVWRRRQRA